MANPSFETGFYYHIYNRGVEKRTIFTNKFDYHRFLETVNYYRKIPQPKKLSDFKRSNIKYVENQTEIIKISCFCLMPNHYHFVIQQLTEGGITDFLRKLSDSYTKYFNTKYERVGPLFQGTFKAKLIENDEYLLQVSKYIHRNSFPLKMWEGKIFPYSSYHNYISGEEHEFCDTDFILSYFSHKNPNIDYRTFVQGNDNIDPTIFSYFLDNDDCAPTWNVGS